MEKSGSLPSSGETKREISSDVNYAIIVFYLNFYLFNYVSGKKILNLEIAGKGVFWVCFFGKRQSKRRVVCSEKINQKQSKSIMRNRSPGEII